MQGIQGHTLAAAHARVLVFFFFSVLTFYRIRVQAGFSKNSSGMLASNPNVPRVSVWICTSLLHFTARLTRVLLVVAFASCGPRSGGYTHNKRTDPAPFIHCLLSCPSAFGITAGLLLSPCRGTCRSHAQPCRWLDLHIASSHLPLNRLPCGRIQGSEAASDVTSTTGSVGCP